MVVLERAPQEETISGDKGSRINGILRELTTVSGAESALLVRTEGALIAWSGNGQTNQVECMAILCALISGAAQAIARSIGTSLHYVHQHGDKNDMLLLEVNETFGLVISFHELLGLGGILFHATANFRSQSMKCDLLKWPVALVLISFTGTFTLSAQTREAVLGNVLPTTAVLLPRIEPETMQQNIMVPAAGNDVFLNLLLASATKDAGSSVGVAPNANPQNTPAPVKPRAMTMLSISCNEPGDGGLQALAIHCRTDGYLSNAGPSGRILIKGVVTEDVVSGGRILIAAGSKVAGIGHVDPDSGRVESKGDWSIVTDHQEVRVHAEIQDGDGGFHGIPGQETSFESELAQSQAVARDGRYCFIANKTHFTLSIKGDVAITVLKPLESSE
jgi:predicted regulator of Ras-like GTPase activity (Roadblock/LC7/MglB family)